MGGKLPRADLTAPASTAIGTSTSASSDSSSESQASSSSFKKPRPRPTPLRLHTIGVDASQLIGKVLTYVRRSPTHPSVTLSFSDGSSFRILVDGYDPLHRGIPKNLEMDGGLAPIFDPPEGSISVELPITDCLFIRLLDKAFEQRIGDHAQRWDQSHQGLAFKFGKETSWHCIWAILEERDNEYGVCIFRSFDDIYLDKAHHNPRSPRKRNWQREHRKSSE